MAKVQISAMVEPQEYELWKASGRKAGEIFKLGLMNMQQTPGYVGRIRELEEGNDKLQRKITILMNRVNELEKVHL